MAIDHCNCKNNEELDDVLYKEQHDDDMNNEKRYSEILQEHDLNNFRNWSLLPQDVLTIIGELLSLPHRVCFRAVCKSWCSSISPVSIPSPWLLLPGKGPQYGEYENDSLTFFSVPADKTFEYPLAGISGMHCVGSQDGWLAMADLTFNLCIVNPLTGARINLPPFYNHPFYEPVYATADDGSSVVTHFNDLILLDEVGRVKHEFDRSQCIITKIVFCPNPTPTNFTVVALFLGLALVFVRAGDTKWSTVELNKVHLIADVAYYREIFLALTHTGSLLSIDLRQSLPKEFPIILVGKETDCSEDSDNDIYFLSKYLALSKTNDVFMIIRDGTHQRHLDRTYKYHTTKLTIMKLCGPKFHRHWDAINNLEGETLFVGNNSCFFLSAEDSCQLRDNCIYLTDILHPRVTAYDMGIFDLAKQSFELIYSDLELNWLEPQAIWFKPTMK